MRFGFPSLIIRSCCHGCHRRCRFADFRGRLIAVRRANVLWQPRESRNNRWFPQSSTRTSEEIKKKVSSNLQRAQVQPLLPRFPFITSSHHRTFSVRLTHRDAASPAAPVWLNATGAPPVSNFISLKCNKRRVAVSGRSSG